MRHPRSSSPVAAITPTTPELLSQFQGQTEAARKDGQPWAHHTRNMSCRYTLKPAPVISYSRGILSLSFGLGTGGARVTETEKRLKSSMKYKIRSYSPSDGEECLQT